jgi:hypothetical protein
VTRRSRLLACVPSGTALFPPVMHIAH